ncbi:hypothetical protein HanHA89_Chr10g0387921 [Helianthus annuus]|nr:hypothetical protein HanHA89_Chr10g0387921 [Helianthus annuus]
MEFPATTVNYGSTVIYGKDHICYSVNLLVYGDQTFPGLTVNYGDTIIYGGSRITFIFSLFLM